MSEYISLLPHVNALLNATSAVFLIVGYAFIRKLRINAHRNCQISAVVSSSFFLISYITYHSLRGSKHFLGQGIARPIYFTVLTSHTILAVIIVPLVLVTLYRAARGNFVKHRAIARWTLPLWLYVSVTGVIVYLMLYQIYSAP